MYRGTCPDTSCSLAERIGSANAYRTQCRGAVPCNSLSRPCLRRLEPAPPCVRQVVVSNAPSCGGVAYAEQRGIPTLRYPGRKDDPQALTPAQLVESLRDRHRVDVVCLAGYMKARRCGYTLSVTSRHLRFHSTVRAAMNRMQFPASGPRHGRQSPVAKYVIKQVHGVRQAECYRHGARAPHKLTDTCPQWMADSKSKTAAVGAGRAGAGVPPGDAQHPPGTAAGLWWQGLLRRARAQGSPPSHAHTLPVTVTFWQLRHGSGSMCTGRSQNSVSTAC